MLPQEAPNAPAITLSRTGPGQNDARPAGVSGSGQGGADRTQVRGDRFPLPAGSKYHLRSGSIHQSRRVFDMISVRPAFFSCLFVILSLVWGPPLLVAGGIADARPPGGDSPPAGVLDVGSQTIELTLEIADSSGRLIPARAQVTGADGHAYPRGPDSGLLSHSSLGGYFYVDGRATLAVPPGLSRVTISRGFEFSPVSQYVTLQGDTTLQVTLQRFATLPALGWYGGDLHSHARHDPLDYTPTPEQVKLVAAAEGLSVLHLLDNEWQFTGGPHALSDSAAPTNTGTRSAVTSAWRACAAR
jgi:hypothetical protein